MNKVVSNRSLVRASHFVVALASVGFLSIGCKEKSKNKAPAPTEKPSEPEKPVVTPPPDSTASGNQQPSAPKITGTAANNAGLEFKVNETVRMQLGVEGTNVSTNQYEFSLARMPVGAQLTNRQGPNPELIWNAAAEGTYDVQVIARNMSECQKILGAQSQQCSVPTSQFGRVVADPRFDLVQNFQFKVGRGVPQTGNYGNQSPYQGGYSGGMGYGDKGYTGGSKSTCRTRCGCK